MSKWERFVNEAQEHGFTEEQAEFLWSWIVSRVVRYEHQHMCEEE